MKYMFGNSHMDNIAKLPEPFRSACQTARLWKYERDQGLTTTGVMAACFPKDPTQDVSFTFWCGLEEAYRLNNTFGLQREISS